MTAKRYLNAILTLIALELGWIALNHSAVPVAAQPAATPVVITGINLRSDDAPLPVALRGPIEIRATAPVPIVATRPIEVFIPVTTSSRPGLPDPPRDR
jgi:hypothetical protein